MKLDLIVSVCYDIPEDSDRILVGRDLSSSAKSAYQTCQAFAILAIFSSLAALISAFRSKKLLSVIFTGIYVFCAMITFSVWEAGACSMSCDTEISKRFQTLTYLRSLKVIRVSVDKFLRLFL